jgi:formamidopyrimidine-DNA glycosylase
VPELPEVETTCRGIAPHLVGKRVTRVVVRNPRLRWRVPNALGREISGQVIRSVTRRAKYILVATDAGTAIMHLGMSGSLRIVSATRPPGKWDHVDVVLAGGGCLRLRDPRRFGSILWTRENPLVHKLLAGIGPEPLTRAFSGAYLHDATRGRSRAIRDVLLDSHVVAGVGNIYANEALFGARVRPTRAAGRLTRNECKRLVATIRATLNRAIRSGGSTLRDYHAADGEAGYFQLTLRVYGRNGEPCRVCRTPIRLARLGQRSAFYCPKCQR